MIQLLLEADYSVLVIFDKEDRQHKALRCHKGGISHLLLKREERESREFLTDLRPIVRKLNNDDSIYTFLTIFTETRPLRWHEAAELIVGDISLRNVAFNLAQNLPESYLRQYSTPTLNQTFWRPKQFVSPLR